jgi:stage V sporulation protein SpoVS
LAWVWAESEPQKLVKSGRNAEPARPEINTIPGNSIEQFIKLFKFVALIRKFVEQTGHPGVDYPIFAAVPQTSFTCQGKIAGYYADTEASCQVI